MVLIVKKKKSFWSPVEMKATTKNCLFSKKSELIKECHEIR